MELAIEFNAFKSSIDSFVKRGEEIQGKRVKDETELQSFLEEKEAWGKEVFRFLSESFTGDDSDYFANLSRENNTYNLGYKLPIAQQVENAKSDLIQKISNLKYYVRLLNISDAFINPEIVKTEGRENWSVKKKKLFLLKKLKELNDGKYYDVNYIFWSNDVGLNNDEEPRQIAKSLEEDCYVKLMGLAMGVSASITIEGVDYIESIVDEQEEKAKTNKAKEDTTIDLDAISDKLDEVTEWLKKNDMGNEIIFNEIQELRDAGKKLDLKNWKQLLKGKLFELGSNTAINLGVEGSKSIFKIITGEESNKFLG